MTDRNADHKPILAAGDTYVDGQGGCTLHYRESDRDATFMMWSATTGSHYVTTSLEEAHKAMGKGELPERVATHWSGFLANQPPEGTLDTWDDDDRVAEHVDRLDREEAEAAARAERAQIEAAVEDLEPPDTRDPRLGHTDSCALPRAACEGDPRGLGILRDADITSLEHIARSHGFKRRLDAFFASVLADPEPGHGYAELACPTCGAGEPDGSDPTREALEAARGALLVLLLDENILPAIDPKARTQGLAALERINGIIGGHHEHLEDRLRRTGHLNPWPLINACNALAWWSENDHPSKADLEKRLAKVLWATRNALAAKRTHVHIG